MKFLLDQNISPRTASHLKSIGLDAAHINEFGMGGASDEEIYKFAADKKFILVTFDHEFSYRFISDRRLPGLVLLRVHPQTLEILHPVLEDFFKKIKLSEIENSIVVVERDRFRIKKIK